MRSPRPDPTVADPRSDDRPVMRIKYVNLEEWIEIAIEVLGLFDTTVRRVADLNGADSALHAPAAGFGDTEFYPDLIMKAAVLGHLVKNHALPDGNKRTAFLTMVDFIRGNRATWTPGHEWSTELLGPGQMLVLTCPVASIPIVELYEGLVGPPPTGAEAVPSHP